MEKILVFAREDERFKDRYIYACTVMGYEPVRAYTEAAKEGILNSVIIEKIPGIKISLKTDYMCSMPNDLTAPQPSSWQGISSVF